MNRANQLLALPTGPPGKSSFYGAVAVESSIERLSISRDSALELFKHNKIQFLLPINVTHVVLQAYKQGARQCTGTWRQTDEHMSCTAS